MPAPWTKEDYDTNYRFRVERYFGGRPNTRDEVKVHYHKWAMQPIVSARWAVLQPVLNILTTDNVLVVGAGFGWGVDAITAEANPANIVGIDVSTYITDNQTGTEEAELRAKVTAVGLDPDIGRGLELMGHIYDGLPRSNVIILNNDASTGPQRNEIRTALGGNNPSICISEDIIDDDWTDVEIQQMRDAMNGFGGTQRLIFVYKGTATRSHQDVLDLLPGSAEVISTDGQIYLVK
jgi:hypothetical protein